VQGRIAGLLVLSRIRHRHKLLGDVGKSRSVLYPMQLSLHLDQLPRPRYTMEGYLVSRYCLVMILLLVKLVLTSVPCAEGIEDGINVHNDTTTKKRTTTASHGDLIVGT